MARDTHREPSLLDQWFGALNSSPLLPEVRPIAVARATLLTLSATLFGLILWAGLTQVKEVASSPGQVMPSGHVQMVQHLEGGILRELRVREGDVVEKGEVLMRLDPTSATSDLNQLKQQQMALAMEAERYRALAENRVPDFSAFKEATPAMVAEQRQAFDSMRTARGGEADIISAQLAQRREAMKSAQARANSLRDNLAIARESLSIKKGLYEKGYYSRLAYLEKQEDVNRTQGDYQAVLQEIERIRSEIAEYSSRLTSAGQTADERAHQELARLQGEQAKTHEALAKYNDRVDRLNVRAPVRGIVKGIEVTTLGGIVTPGQTLMEVVPLDDKLMVEARVRPADVGALRPGLPVRVRVQAFDYTRFGGAQGTLDSVSATTFVDDQRQNYYKAFIELEREYVGREEEKNLLVPGMTVDADIITGERSLLGYLLKPIRSAAATAFTER